LLELALVFGVKNGNEIIEEVKSVIQQWAIFAKEAGVSSTSKMLISRTLKSLVS